MILLCGIPSELPLVMVKNQLDRINIPYVIFNQREFAKTKISFEISNSYVKGQLDIGNRNYKLEDFNGIFLRLMDDQCLPEIENEPSVSIKRQYCRNLHDTLCNWLEITPARVINRISSMTSNFSKPYQTQIIRKHGFLIPETIITNDPDIVRAFFRDKEHIIYKSISSERSIVQEFEEKDIDRLDYIRWCPTQFQEFIEGIDVRVHVVNTEVFATSVESSAIDYRYAHQQGSNVKLKAIELSEKLTEKCIKLTETLSLKFAGIDLKLTQNNEVYCFEVNTCPAFNYYEMSTGQPISRAIAHYLAGDV